MKTQKQRMINGELYKVDESLREEFLTARKNLKDFNNSLTIEEMKENAKKLFGSFEEGAFVTPPFNCDYGKNIYLEKYAYFKQESEVNELYYHRKRLEYLHYRWGFYGCGKGRYKRKSRR